MGGSSSQIIRTIGRVERVDFPEWDLFDINAKVDTGAYTSSLHAHHIKAVKKERGLHVQFCLLDPSHPAYNDRKFDLPVHQRKVVRSSNGTAQRRYIVKTVMRIFDQNIPIELSLTDRTEMKYPVLLGRKVLQGRFIVDVAKINLSKKAKK